MAAQVTLPVEEALPALRAALLMGRHAVLQAPPGAGKSTRVPLALLAEPWARGKRILLQEPRRLAARAVAERMAVTSGDTVGGLIGLRMRFDTRVSRATRIEVITEGVLTRMLEADPALEGVGAVLFDEFHERSLTSDLALALALEAEAQLGCGPRLLVMSATLDGERVAALLGSAPLITAAGRAHPVEIRYAGRGAAPLPGGSEIPERQVAQLVLQALREERGDLLVFLAGQREIHRVAALLAGRPETADVELRPLHGTLSLQAQHTALAPASAGRRRVVLATNIAETSLTIEGVRVVIDSGLARRSVFDPATGMSRLETERISRASAAQRAGRAGRLAPGVCYRLWSEAAERQLPAFAAPEIMAADLSSLALELAAWGIAEPRTLQWLDPPPAATFASARDLLRRLGALDEAGGLSSEGRALVRLPLHPRLAHMLRRAQALGCVRLAAELAALLSERDLLHDVERDADLSSRLALLRDAGAGAVVAVGARERVRRMAAQFESAIKRSAPTGASAASAVAGAHRLEVSGVPEGVLLAFAYPDRIGKRRPGGAGRYTLANGRGAYFAAPERLSAQEFIVAVELDDRDRDARIRLAVALERAALLEYFGSSLRELETVAWDEREEAVVARRRVLLDRLVIDERPLLAIDPAAAVAAMLEGVRGLGLEALPWEGAARELRARMQFVRRLGRADAGSWPEVDDAALERTLEGWLAPWLGGITRRAQLGRVPLAATLRALLEPHQQRLLAQLAPPTLTVPSGSRLRIDYEGDNAPSVAVKLQELFGEPETPRVGGGAVPVTFVLLSPAGRPLQITRDLASFWRNAYIEVRKDMRGRYPRHPWPQDPLAAAPTRGPRPRRS